VHQEKYEMLRVLVVAQTPPPFGGAPILTERFVNSEMAGVQTICVRMALSSHIQDHGRFRVSKIVHMCSIVFRMLYHRFFGGARILYYVPSGPDRLPMFRDFFILLPTRWLFDKTVFHFHMGGISDLYDRLPVWQRWLFRRAYYGADAAVRPSELNPEDGRRLEAKCEYIIPYGIDDPCPGLVVPRSRTVTPTEPLRILFVGMLRESKGVMVLIEACGQLAAQGVPFQVELMGQWRSEAFADRVKRRIEELGLCDQVRFLGELLGDEKFAAYRRADVFCFPSFFSSETFGIVLLEAMAHGLPAVSTRWRGIPSVVDDGRTGLLVEPHDPQAVAEQLAVLTADAELRERMGRAGRAKFEREYTFQPYISRMRLMLLETAGLQVEEESAWNANENSVIKQHDLAEVAAV
jgi:glycosyltransferase involved in cell wall biosynthesis